MLIEIIEMSNQLFYLESQNTEQVLLRVDKYKQAVHKSNQITA